MPLIFDPLNYNVAHFDPFTSILTLNCTGGCGSIFCAGPTQNFHAVADCARSSGWFHARDDGVWILLCPACRPALRFFPAYL